MTAAEGAGFQPDATIKSTGERVQIVKLTTVWGQPGIRVRGAHGIERDWHRDAVECDD